MFAAELINDEIAPLNPADSVQRASERMAEFHVSNLPVVNKGMLLGLVSESDVMAEAHAHGTVSALPLPAISPYVREDQHIYDVIRLFYAQQLSLVPVVDVNNNYLGCISVNAMNKWFAIITSVAEPGGIIVLEISNRNNSLSHMAQIVESDNAQILSSYVRSFPDSTRMEITLKVNKQDISGIVATFLRYGYDIKATFNHNEYRDSAMNRYDALMNYLNL
jgi:acetoin utilization protein AcuB